jgi:hypothetical protein
MGSEKGKPGEDGLKLKGTEGRRVKGRGTEGRWVLRKRNRGKMG